MSLRRAHAVFAGGIFVLSLSGFAFADGLGPLPLDRSVAQERNLYAKLHIEARYGITFRPYARVCNDRHPGVANCRAMVITDSSGTPLAFDPAKGDLPGYSPKELRAAYGVSGVANGQPIIGIVDAYGDPSAASDLKAYSKEFNLPVLPACKGDVSGSGVPCIEVVNQKGKTNALPAYDPTWAAEQSIDVQMAHALCENCSILLVETNSNPSGCVCMD